MADEEKNETTEEETPEVEAVAESRGDEVSDTEVSDTVPEPEAAVEEPEARHRSGARG